MFLVPLFAHMNISRVRVSCTATGLDVLNQGCVEVKADNKIAVGYIDAFFCNRGSKETVDCSIPEVQHRNDLLTERHIQVSSVARSCSNQSANFEVRCTYIWVGEKSSQKS